jgi:hypothetical protein
MTRISSTNRMGSRVTTGAKKDAVTTRISPGAARALATFPAAERDAIIAGARIAAAARGASAAWDIDVAAAVGVPMNPASVAAWRVSRGIPRPSVAWPVTPHRTPAADFALPGVGVWADVAPDA